MANTFAVSTANDVTVTAGTGSLSVDAIENLTGGGLGDTFNFTGTGDITGTTSGLGGGDTFNFVASTVLTAVVSSASRSSERITPGLASRHSL